MPFLGDDDIVMVMLTISKGDRDHNRDRDLLEGVNDIVFLM